MKIRYGFQTKYKVFQKWNLVGVEGGEEVGEEVLVVAALDEGVEADQEEDEALLWRRLAAVVELQRFDEVGHDFRGFLCWGSGNGISLGLDKDNICLFVFYLKNSGLTFSEIKVICEVPFDMFCFYLIVIKLSHCYPIVYL